MHFTETHRGPERLAGESGISPAQPHIGLLHGCMFLSGFGTVFLGPVLPVLVANAHTTDSGGGLFFTAQFLGAFCGGVTTSSRIWLSLIRGTSAACLGFFSLALSTHLQARLFMYLVSLAVLGFGAGQMLTSTNLLASRLFAAVRGSALAKINFTWSLGALLGPYLLGSTVARTSLTVVLFAASVLFALALAAAVWNNTIRPQYQSTNISMQKPQGLVRSAFVYFAFLLLLYGGVETSLSGWITTFGTRYGSETLRSSSFNVTALWIGITAGRALTPMLLTVTSGRKLLLFALTTAAVLTALLTQADGAAAILTLAVLLGLALAPWFPLVLAAILAEGATATQAGSIIAVSGIGAAVLPFLIGVLSRSTTSLRAGLLVPLCGVVLLLGLGLRQSPERA